MEHELVILTNLLNGFNQARAEWESKQVSLAENFNLFHVMLVNDKEAIHSRILAWLLDRRLEHGSHSQGNLGFRLFIEETGSLWGADAMPQIMEYPNMNYWVRREVSGKTSRIDIEVAATGQFLIHIENKIRSSEGEQQTHREWRDLERRAIKLGIPASNIHGIFLTLHGSPPGNTNFSAVAWRRLVRVFERFAAQAEPPSVKLFVSHYANTIAYWR